MATTSPITPFPLGAYLGNPNGSSASAEASFEADDNSFTAMMGAAPTYLDNYVDYTQPISDWVGNAGWQAWSDAQSADAKTMTPVVGLPMASTASGAPSADAQYQQIAAGDYDSVYQGIVQAYAANGYTNLVFRPGWEMNIDGPTYAGDTAQDQADWVAAYQHIYTVLHQEAAALGVNVTVVWNPSTTNYTNANALTSLYPGNAYVDAIGADVYSDMYPYSDGSNSSGQATYHDWGTGAEDTSTAQFIASAANREHYWTYPAATEWSNDGSGGHALSLDQIIQFAEQQGKPLAIPETGAGNSDAGTDVSDDAAFPQWLAQQLTTAQAQGEKIDFVNLWDSNGGGNYEFSNASDGKPQEAAAWAQYFGAQTTTATSTTATTSTSASTGTSTTTAGTASASTSAGSTSTTPTSTPPAPITLGSGHDAIVLDLAEDAYQGDAQYTVSVDGTQVGGTQTETASNAAGQSQQVTLLGNWGNGTHAVSVDFLNDDYAGTPSTDRNLYVTSASYNGTTDANDTLALMSSGAQNLTVGTAAPATSAPPASITLGSGHDAIVLDLAEDAYQGDAQYTVSVDGIQVGGTQTETASNAAGQSQQVTLAGNWGDGTHTVSVNFLSNDYAGTPSTGRNLYVTSASYDGITDANDTLALMSSSAQSLTVGTAAPGPTVVGSGPDTIALGIAEDYCQDNAQFTVTVDGQQIGGIQQAVASYSAGQSQTFDVEGDFGAGQHTVSVDFLNDNGGYGNTDRNLYVTSASYDRATDANDTLALYCSGSQSLTVGTPVAPVISGLTAATDTGISAEDGITFDVTPTVTGTAQAGTTVTLDGANGSVLGTATASSSGIWSVAVGAALSNGQHALTATAAASGDISAASAAYSVTIDTTAPTMTAASSSIAKGDTLSTGQKDVLSFATSEPVAVVGSPTLSLSDGGIASYDVTESTSTSLAFDYVPTAAQTSTGLAVSGLALNGGSITDTAGNALTTAGSSSLVGSNTGVVVNPAATAPSSSPIVLGSGSDTIAVKVSEDAWDGNAQFTILVDGKQVGGTQTATASHAAGQDQTYDLDGDFGAGQHTVSIDFLNDNGGYGITDRNLYVDGVSYDGTVQANSTLTLYSSGTQSLTVTTPMPATTTIGSGSDSLVLTMAEDYYQGDAQFTVSVDGKQVGGTQTVQAINGDGQTQQFVVDGNWGAGTHTVSVDFLNDDYAGTPSTDRNLYVKSVTYDGTAQPGSLSLMGNGSQGLTATSSTSYSPGAEGGTITTLGNDTVTVGSGAVTVHADGPSVNVTGGAGSLTFVGGSGTSAIVGGSGAASITGSAGTLTFTAGSGEATITAGSGNEVYDILDGEAGGSIWINDFVSGTDTIHLSGYAGTGVRSETVVNGSTQIVLTDSTKVTLVGSIPSGGRSIFS